MENHKHDPAKQTKRDPHIPLRDKAEISSVGYQGNIEAVGRSSTQGFTNLDSSDLHNTISLNDFSTPDGRTATAKTYSNSINIARGLEAPSKLNINPRSTKSRVSPNTDALSQLYGADPTTVYKKGNPGLD